ncbi:MAG: Rpn family recombination-promoting nuclease/putative transposase [Campylobacterales bacterium]
MTDEQKSIIVHIEFQTSNHKDMHFRMLRYITEIHKLYSLPVVQLVLYIGKSKLNMKNGININIQDTNIDYRYKIVDIKTLDCDRFLNSNESDMVILALLCDIESKDKNKLVKTILERLYAINSCDINSYKNSVLKLEVLSELRKLQDVVKEEEIKMVETKAKNILRKANKI